MVNFIHEENTGLGVECLLSIKDGPGFNIPSTTKEKKMIELGLMPHAYNSSTWEVKAGRF
jgi:hypothetical protein